MPETTKSVLAESPSRYPPGPRGGFFGVKYVGELQRDPMTFTKKVFDQYGDFTYVRLGWVRLYFVNRPTLIREVLTSKMKYFRRLPKQMKALRKIEGDGLVVSEGSIWARHRPVVQGIFHQRYFANYAVQVEAFTRRWMKSLQPDTPFDLAESMNQLALQIIAKLVFDVDLIDEAGRLRQAIHDFRAAMQSEVNSPIHWLFIRQKIRQRRGLRAMNDMLWRFIREHRAATTPKLDMLGLIMAVGDQVTNGPPISDAEIRDEVSTLFVAGHDTTSAALAWFWYCLAKNPDVEARIIEEVDRVVGNRTVHFEDVAQLKYLEMTVKESMRLYPAAGYLFGRQAVENVELGGHIVPKGAWVFMSPFVVHRDPNNYPNPEKFDPERFAPGRINDIPAYGYIPFGGGSRTCIGNGMAMMEIILLAASVLQEYRLVLDPTQADPEIELEIVLRPKGGLKMRAMPR